MEVETGVKHRTLVESAAEVLAKRGVPAPVRAVEAEVMAKADPRQRMLYDLLIKA